jgi:predicted phosphoribosyltransferase
MGRRFRDRRDAGRVLARRLARFGGRDVVVLALPRGGVPVGFEVAIYLGVPLDVFLVRKLGVPGQEELAMGAIASGGLRVVNEEIVSQLRIPDEVIERVAAREEEELALRERLYRHGGAQDVRGRIALVVDDGLATGSTMRAAVAALRRRSPARLVVAVPVASREACADIGALADEILCALTPSPFGSVGRWYEDFTPTGDEEVRALLAAAAAGAPLHAHP